MASDCNWVFSSQAELGCALTAVMKAGRSWTRLPASNPHTNEVRPNVARLIVDGEQRLEAAREVVVSAAVVVQDVRVVLEVGLQPMQQHTKVTGLAALGKAR